MAPPDLPFDPAGCKVARITWPANGVQMALGEKTAEGRAVAGVTITFESVANLYAVRQFLAWKRTIEEKGQYRANKAKDYPLKLPATLAHLAPAPAGELDYGDEAFTDAHGSPPPLRSGQRAYLFALAEKRFRDREPFPIVCRRVVVAGLAGDSRPEEEIVPASRWTADDFRAVGLRFVEAVVLADQKAAQGLLTKTCRKRLGKPKLADRLGGWWGSAVGAKPPRDQIREQLYANVQDSEVVWETVQNPALPDLPPEAVLAVVETGAAFLRDALYVYLLEEDGELRLDVGFK